MTVFISIVAVITAIVILATKSVDLASSIIKYRKDKPTPTVPIATSIASQNMWRLRVWRAVEDLLSSLLSGFIIFGVMQASGPVTRFDVGAVGMAIIIYASTLRSKPNAQQIGAANERQTGHGK
jgi:hypothetical protein